MIRIIPYEDKYRNQCIQLISEALGAYATVVESDLNSTEASFVVMIKNDIVIGTGCFIRLEDTNIFELCYIVISDEERNKGYGRRLISSIENEIKELGGTYITLLTTVPKFYLKLKYDQMSDDVEGYALMKKLLKKEAE